MQVKNKIKLNRFIDSLITDIIKFDKIALFVHEDPDFDAMGSAFGLRDIITTNFKNKEVHVMKMQTALDLHLTLNFMPAEEELNFDQNLFVQDALAISVDTPVLKRVLGKDLFSKCKTTFRVDHHQYLEKFTDYEYIETDACSTCQLIIKIALNANLKIPSTSASYLYAGLLTDTNRFLFNSVTDETYQYAAQLYKLNADRNKVHDVLYTRTINQIRYENYLFNLAKFQDHVASLWIPKNSNLEYGIDNPKGYVYVIANIKDFPVWVASRWNEEKQSYSCSVRSIEMPIFEIARKYRGGGHLLASGCTVKNEEEFNQLVHDLINAYKEYKKDHEKTRIC